MKKLIALLAILALFGCAQTNPTPQEVAPVYEGELYYVTIMFSMDATLDEIQVVVDELMTRFDTEVVGEFPGSGYLVYCEEVGKCMPIEGEIIIQVPETDLQI